MALGPGKYTDITTSVREQTKARAVVLMVVGGDKGTGFEVQAPLELTQMLPVILRGMADEIERTG